MTGLWDMLSDWFGIHPILFLTRSAIISPAARIKRISRLELGAGVTIQALSVLHCGGQAWSGHQGHIRIGRGSVVGPGCVLYGSGGIELGAFVHLGPGAKLISQVGVNDGKRLTANPTLKFAPIRVGDGAWVGAGAVILHGSTLGKNVTVAPNAVVSGEFGDYAIIAGNPARVIGRNAETSQEVGNAE